MQHVALLSHSVPGAMSAVGFPITVVPADNGFIGTEFLETSGDCVCRQIFYVIDFRDGMVVPGSVGEGRRWVKVEKGEVFRRGGRKSR